MKTCNEPGCRNPVWSHLKCRNHQWRRTDPKKPKGLSNYRKPTGELDLFKSIWEERPHVSEISGKPLDEFWGTMLFVNCFPHLMNKGKYPEIRLQKDCIALSTPYEHFLIDFGTEAMRKKYEQENNCSFQIFYDKQEQLKQKYEV